MTARHLLSADVAPAAQCLGRAFSEDPVIRWLAGAEDSDDHIGRSVEGFFAPALDVGLGRGHAYVVTGQDGLESVAVWSPPDVAMMDETHGMAFATAFSEVYGEAATARLAALNALTSELHPTELPHFYLFILGSSSQGRGAGGQAIAPVLGRCDAEGLGSYLESSNCRNLGFYQRHGFKQLWQERLESDGPLLTGMWRDPQ